MEEAKIGAKYYYCEIYDGRAIFDVAEVTGYDPETDVVKYKLNGEVGYQGKREAFLAFYLETPEKAFNWEAEIIEDKQNKNIMLIKKFRERGLEGIMRYSTME